MDQSHGQRAQRLIQTELAENAVHPADGSGVGSVAVLLGIVSMGVVVNEVVMSVGVRMRVSMRVRGISGGRKRLGDPARESREIQEAEKDQHQADGQLHGEAEPGRNDHSKKNNCRADQKNREGMSEAPQHADQSSVSYAALPAHDGGDGDHVVGVGGVTHTEKKSQGDDGEQSDHLQLRLPRSLGVTHSELQKPKCFAIGNRRGHLCRVINITMWPSGILTALLLRSEMNRGSWYFDERKGARNGGEVTKIVEKKGFLRGRAHGVLCRLYLSASLLPNSAQAKQMTENLFSLTRRVLLTCPRKSVNCDFLQWLHKLT